VEERGGERTEGVEDSEREAGRPGSALDGSRSENRLVKVRLQQQRKQDMRTEQGEMV